MFAEKEVMFCVVDSTWTHCGSSSTRTYGTCSIRQVFRCMTYHRTPSTLTTSMN